jgi:hypothetical protein
MRKIKCPISNHGSDRQGLCRGDGEFADNPRTGETMNHSMTRNEKVEARVTSSHCGFPPPGAKRQKRGVSLLMVVMVLYLGWGLAAGPVHGADPQTFAGSILSATTDDPADKEQNKVAGPGWFWNLGPTGIRAMLVDASGKCEWEGKATCFLVKYVFPKSPADGKILPGDTIIGVNAKKFSTVYKASRMNKLNYFALACRCIVYARRDCCSMGQG